MILLRSLPAAVGLLAALAAVSGPGCSKHDASGEGVPLAPSASALAPSRAAPSTSVVAFTIAQEGTTQLDMPAPKEHIKAHTAKAGGTLEVDLANLGNTRGEVKIDLTTLTTTTFGGPRDADQTRHARTWLEVGDAVDDAARERNRWATLAVRRVEVQGEADAAKIPMGKDDAGPVRIVKATVTGEFLLHGRKVEKTAPVLVKLRYAAGAAPDAKPVALEIKNESPFTVTLAEHDVKPRDTFGKFAQGSLGLLGTKVAETAAVTLDLKATPAS